MDKRIRTASFTSQRGQSRFAALGVIGLVLVVSFLAYFWIWRGRGKAEDVAFSFLKNSYLAENLLEPTLETQVIFGDPQYADALVGGFSETYDSVDEVSTLWAVGAHSSLIFDINRVSDKTAYLRCAPFVYEDMNTQTLTLILNDKLLQSIDLEAGWAEYTIPIPASQLVQGQNLLEMEYTHASVPAEITGEEDTRPLSVSFDYLRIKNPPVRKPAAVQTWTIQDQAKNVVATTHGESLNYYMEMPAAARLRFDFGVQPDTLTKLQNVTYKVIVQPDDDSGPQEVVSTTLDKDGLPSSWISEDVDLTKLARRLVRVTFQALTGDPSASGSVAWAGWGNPRVIVTQRERSSADGKTAAPPPVTKPPYNIVLIFLDGLRADHTAHLGYHRATTPKIDELARESIYFSQAITTSNRVLPSHGSVLTGLYPYMHGVRSAENAATPPATVHWLSALQSGGAHYNAVAFLEDPDLKPYYGSLGFQTVLTSSVDPPPATSPSQTSAGDRAENAESTSAAPRDNPSLTRLTRSLQAARAWLYENANEHFFMVYQTSFLLPPFMPPTPYGQMFYPEYYSDADRVLSYQVNEATLQKIQDRTLRLQESDVKQIRALYDGKLRYLDVQMGELFSQMNELGVGKNTILILTSSQGLQLGEHGVIGALGQTLYDEEIHVPLIMRFPDAFKLPTKPVNTQVRLIDLMPTVLYTLGITPAQSLSGVNLAPVFKGQSLDLPAVSESFSPPLMTIRSSEWKLSGRVFGRWVERSKLFNIRLDVGESNNFIRYRPVMSGYLGQNLDGRLAYPDKTY